MAYTKYSLTPANNNAAPPDGAPEGMLPSAVNDTMRDMMAQIRDAGDGIRNGTYTMTAPVITGGSITGVALSGNTLTNPVITGGSINNTPIGASTANTGAFTTLGASGVATFSAGTVSAPAITTTGDTNTGIFFPAADTIAFTEGGVESMRIDSSGNVGIGTSSPNSAAVNRALTISGTANSILELNAGATRCGYMFANSTATIFSAVPASSIMQFNTVDTERMRIDSSGNLLVGTTSNFPGSGNTNVGFMYENQGTLFVSRAASDAAHFNRNSDGSLVSFRRSGTEVGSVRVTTVLTTYNTTSDYRLKTVVAPVSDSGSRLDELQPIEYDWKAGGRTRGFLAHQFAEVYPSSVSGEKDAVDKNGKPVYQAMQASTPEVMADLIAEIQSLRKRVAQLESK